MSASGTGECPTVVNNNKKTLKIFAISLYLFHPKCRPVRLFEKGKNGLQLEINEFVTFSNCLQFLVRFSCSWPKTMLRWSLCIIFECVSSVCVQCNRVNDSMLNCGTLVVHTSSITTTIALHRTKNNMN